MTAGTLRPHHVEAASGAPHPADAFPGAPSAPQAIAEEKKLSIKTRAAALLGSGAVIGAATLAGLGSIAGIAQAGTAPQTPAATAASLCGWSPTDNGSGSMHTNKPIRLRLGPASDCDTIGWTTMPTGQKLWAWCKYVNYAGNTWYYVRPDESGWSNGWVWSGNVTGVPSGLPRCQL